MEQYVNLIKAVTSLLLLFFVSYVYKSCKEKHEVLPILQQITIQNEKLKIDSSINRIPFTYADSERTNYLQNYRTYR